jgi:hypothetical protein
LRYALASRPTFLAGSARPGHGIEGYEYAVFGIHSESDAYLLLQVGKAYFKRDYPEGGAYVPERFPPLTSLLANWEKERILSEVDKTWARGGPMVYNNNRDSILIDAAAQRGLDRSDLDRLLFPKQPQPSTLARRAYAVMKALVQNHQVEPNRDAVEDIVLRLGWDKSVGQFAVPEIFGWLAKAMDSDQTNLALKCLQSCIDPDPPIRYLRDRAKTKEAYEELKKAAIPPPLEGLRRGALEDIRARLTDATRGPK